MIYFKLVVYISFKINIRKYPPALQGWTRAEAQVRQISNGDHLLLFQLTCRGLLGPMIKLHLGYRRGIHYKYPATEKSRSLPFYRLA